VGDLKEQLAVTTSQLTEVRERRSLLLKKLSVRMGPGLMEAGNKNMIFTNYVVQLSSK